MAPAPEIAGSPPDNHSRGGGHRVAIPAHPRPRLSRASFSPPVFFACHDGGLDLGQPMWDSLIVAEGQPQATRQASYTAPHVILTGSRRAPHGERAAGNVGGLTGRPKAAMMQMLKRGKRSPRSKPGVCALRERRNVSNGFDPQPARASVGMPERCLEDRGKRDTRQLVPTDRHVKRQHVLSHVLVHEHSGVPSLCASRLRRREGGASPTLK